MRKMSAWTVSVGGRISRKLYTHVAAKRMARKYNAIFRSDRAYATHFGNVTLQPGQRLVGGKAEPVPVVEPDRMTEMRRIIFS